MRTLNSTLKAQIKAAIPMPDSYLLTLPKARVHGLVLVTFVGMRETAGANRSPEIDLMEKMFGVSGVSYCMIEQQNALAYVESLFGVQSKLLASTNCQKVYDDASAKGLTSQTPVQYGLQIWQDGSTENGHVGYIKELYGAPVEYLMTLEGNTSAANTVNANGDISTVKFRRTAGYSASGLHPRGYIDIEKSFAP